MTDELFALDSETRPLKETHFPYALEPYRYGKQATISSVAIMSSGGFKLQLHERDDSILKLKQAIKDLKGKRVYCHSTIFDVAWLIMACGYEVVKDVEWYDTILLAKWIENGQRAYYGDEDERGRTLADLVKRYVPDSDKYKEEFLDIKRAGVTPGQNYEYWLRRGKLDTYMTLKVARILEKKLAPEQWVQYRYEARCIPIIARSWLNGIHFDLERSKSVTPKIIASQKKIIKELGVSEKLIGSPKQLSHWLFVQCGLTPLRKTKLGGSTGKEDLIEIYHETLDARLKGVLDFKQLATLQNKFISAFSNIYEYNGNNIAHASPKLFGTYTGRMTYAAKTQKKFASGFALHQIPRKGPTRKLMIAPPDMYVAEFDAAGQEMRLMGIVSNDQVIIRGFNNGTDMHSDMAAFICGKAYEQFQKDYKSGDDEALNYRYAGKLLNLSCQYRTSGKTVRKKFLTTYNIVIPMSQARSYVNIYARRYPGVKQYWKTAPQFAKETGYAETLGKRRYKIEEWATNTWGCESSAINFPVQGSGADQKEIAIVTAAEKFGDDLHFAMDLHDGLWYYLPQENGKELAMDIKSCLNSINYNEIWDMDVPIPLPFDAKLGNSFGTVEDLK